MKEAMDKGGYGQGYQYAMLPRRLLLDLMQPGWLWSCAPRHLFSGNDVSHHFIIGPCLVEQCCGMHKQTLPLQVAGLLIKGRACAYAWELRCC